MRCWTLHTRRQRGRTGLFCRPRERQGILGWIPYLKLDTRSISSLLMYTGERSNTSRGSTTISFVFFFFFFILLKTVHVAPLTGFGQKTHESGVVKLDENVVGEGWHAVVCVQGA